jgi:hypothetical protein
MSNFRIKNVAKQEKYVEKDLGGNIKKIIFPHQVKVGLTDNSEFNATISGSIHHTNEGISYLVAGSNISVSSGSNGQITISNTLSSPDVFKTITLDGSGAGTQSGDASIVADSSTGTLTLSAGSNITLTGTSSSDTITITSSDTNTQTESFKTISVAGQSDIVADSSTDTLTLVAAGGVTITTNAGSDQITLSSADTNTQTESFKTVALNNAGGGTQSGDASIVADSSTDTLTLSAGSNITLNGNASGDTITISASGGGGGSETIEKIKLTSANGTQSGDNIISYDATHAVTMSAGDNITLNGNASTNTILVSATTSSSDLTVTNHIQPFYLGATPGGDPTAIYHGKWGDGTLSSYDPEQSGNNFIWKYFPTGGTFKKVYGAGEGVSNSSTSNPFTQNAVFAIHKWSDDFVSGLSGATAVRPAIFHVTASPGHSFAKDSTLYHHRSTYNFNLSAGTGSVIISDGSLICVTFKGEGLQRDGFQRVSFFVEWEENIS